MRGGSLPRPGVRRRRSTRPRCPRAPRNARGAALAPAPPPRRHGDLRVIKPQPDAPGYGDEELLARVPAPGDLELTGLKEGVAELAKSALESALTALAPKDRTLLRHHYLDGLTLDQLAGLHRVHRATVARWLQHARHSVLEGTRQRLRAALDTDESEAASLLRLVQSRFDVTLPRLLRDSRP